MKMIYVFALALCLSPGFAFAGEKGQGQGQGQGQQQEQGKGQGQGQYGQGQGQGQGYYSESSSSCREGSEETFLENTDSSGESMQPVRYVCHDGRYVKVFKDARDYGPRSQPIYTCREGSEETFLENTDSSGESMQPVRYICRDGRYVKVFKDARDFGPRERHIYTCREGSEETFLESTDSSGGDDMQPVRYICKGGRYVREFR